MGSPSCAAGPALARSRPRPRPAANVALLAALLAASPGASPAFSSVNGGAAIARRRPTGPLASARRTSLAAPPPYPLALALAPEGASPRPYPLAEAEAVVEAEALGGETRKGRKRKRKRAGGVGGGLALAAAAWWCRPGPGPGPGQGPLVPAATEAGMVRLGSGAGKGGPWPGGGELGRGGGGPGGGSGAGASIWKGFEQGIPNDDLTLAGTGDGHGGSYGREDAIYGEDVAPPERPQQQQQQQQQQQLLEVAMAEEEECIIDPYFDPYTLGGRGITRARGLPRGPDGRRWGGVYAAQAGPRAPPRGGSGAGLAGLALTGLGTAGGSLVGQTLIRRRDEEREEGRRARHRERKTARRGDVGSWGEEEQRTREPPRGIGIGIGIGRGGSRRISAAVGAAASGGVGAVRASVRGAAAGGRGIARGMVRIRERISSSRPQAQGFRARQETDGRVVAAAAAAAAAPPQLVTTVPARKPIPAAPILRPGPLPDPVSATDELDKEEVDLIKRRVEALVEAAEQRARTAEEERRRERERKGDQTASDGFGHMTAGDGPIPIPIPIPVPVPSPPASPPSSASPPSPASQSQSQSMPQFLPPRRVRQPRQDAPLSAVTRSADASPPTPPQTPPQTPTPTPTPPLPSPLGPAKYTSIPVAPADASRTPSSYADAIKEECVGGESDARKKCAPAISSYLDALYSGAVRPAPATSVAISNYLSSLSSDRVEIGSASGAWAVASYLEELSSGAVQAPALGSVGSYLDALSMGEVRVPTTEGSIRSYMDGKSEGDFYVNVDRNISLPSTPDAIASYIAVADSQETSVETIQEEDGTIIRKEVTRLEFESSKVGSTESEVISYLDIVKEECNAANVEATQPSCAPAISSYLDALSTGSERLAPEGSAAISKYMDALSPEKGATATSSSGAAVSTYLKEVSSGAIPAPPSIEVSSYLNALSTGNIKVPTSAEDLNSSMYSILDTRAIFEQCDASLGPTTTCAAAITTYTDMLSMGGAGLDPVTVSAIVDYIVGLVVERVDEGAGRDLSAVIKDYLGQVSSGEIRAPSTASLLSFLEDLAEGRIPSPSTPTSMSLYLGRRRRW